MKQTLFIILVTIFYNVSGQRLGMYIDGNVSFDNALFSISEAGENFPSSLESETSIDVTIYYLGGFLAYIFLPDKHWHINISKIDFNWDDDLIIEARRAGNGNLIDPYTAQDLFIVDGDSYQEISDTPNYFFRGRHGISNIPLQLQISGASLAMGAETYETKIVLTVYEGW